MSHYVLKLYIAGWSRLSQSAVNNLREICESGLRGEYTLEIVDVTESPDLAETAKILATPTLVVEGPGPVRRILGDLSDREKVFTGLGLVPRRLRLDSDPSDPKERL